MEPDLAKIRSVADKVSRCGQSIGGLGRAPHLVSRPQSDYGETTTLQEPFIGSGPTCSVSPPWRSTVRSPDPPRSKGMTRSPAMVARSTYQARSSKPARVTAWRTFLQVATDLHDHRRVRFGEPGIKLF